MENHTINSLSEQRRKDLETVEELGRHVHRLATLLRAAMNTGANQRDDEAWLIDLAHDEAQAAERCYAAWGATPIGEQA